MKKLFSLVLMAVLFVGLVGCNSKTSTSTTLDKEELIIGLDDTFAPMGFKNADGELVGFDIDLATEVFKKLGKKIKFQAIDWAMKETELNAKNIDMIWNGYTVTEERQKKVLFSEPYIDNTQIIVVLKDSSIKTKADLAGKTVATQVDSSTQTAFENDTTGIVKQFNKGTAVYFPNFVDVFLDLDSKRSDAIVGDSIYVKYMIKTQGTQDKYRILSEDFGVEKDAVGFRLEDTELKAKVDSAINDLKKDGTFETIYKKYFSE